MTLDRNSIKRLVYLSLVGLLIYVCLASDVIYTQLQSLLNLGESFIKEYPRLGILVFVLISALSAMLAFFSSAVLVPIGVQTWGLELCLFLLWLGWWLGGLCAYAVGYFAGHRVISLVIKEERMQGVMDLMQSHTRFWQVVLFQTVLPSEIPGYVLGSLRYKLSTYLLALALVELPYAVITVTIGESLVQRDPFLLMLMLSVFLVLLIAAHFIYQRHIVQYEID